MQQCSQRHHFAAVVADIEILDVVGPQAERRISLHVDLIDLVEFVDEIDERGADVTLQRLEDVVHRDAKRLRFGPVDIQVNLRTAGTERRRQPGRDARLRTGRADQFLRCLVELGKAHRAAVLDHHLEATGLAEATDRRGDDDEDERLLNLRELFLQARDDVVLAEIGTTLAPVVVPDERGDRGRQVRAVQNRQTADRHPAIDTRFLRDDGVDLVDDGKSRGCDAASGSLVTTMQ